MPKIKSFKKGVATKMASQNTPMSVSQTMCDPRFSRYWQHYYQTMAWYHKHMNAYYNNALTNTFPHITHDPSTSFTNNNIPNNMFKEPMLEKTSKPADSCEKLSSRMEAVHSESNAKATKTGGKRRKKHKRWRKRHYNIDMANSTADGKQSENEIEMEISDDIIQFFTVSENHRREREAKKAESSNPNTSDPSDLRVNIEAADKRIGTTAPPTQQPGRLRIEEMKLLYGVNAPVIHGLETALQMSFDRITDVYKPILWPNVPLRIIFS